MLKVFTTPLNIGHASLSSSAKVCLFYVAFPSSPGYFSMFGGGGGGGGKCLLTRMQSGMRSSGGGSCGVVPFAVFVAHNSLTLVVGMSAYGSLSYCC